MMITEADRIRFEEATKIVKEMLVDRVWEFDVLMFPNGKYGALWRAGYEIGYAVNIALGDYENALLAHYGDVVSTSRYVKKALDEAKIRDPINMSHIHINYNGLVAETLRVNN